MAVIEEEIEDVSIAPEDETVEEVDFPEDETKPVDTTPDEIVTAYDYDCDDVPTDTTITTGVVCDNNIDIPEDMSEEEVDTVVKATAVMHITLAKVLERLRLITTEEYSALVNAKMKEQVECLEEGVDDVFNSFTNTTPIVTKDNVDNFDYEPLDVTSGLEEECKKN